MPKCDGEILSYPVSVLWVQVSPSYHLLGTQSPPKGSGTFEDGLLRMIQKWWVHTGLLYMHSNEWRLVNNNSLILLKLSGTHLGGECLPTRTIHWSLENALNSLCYSGLEGTLQKRRLFPPFNTSKCSFSFITHQWHCTFKGVTMTYDDKDLHMMRLVFVSCHFVTKAWCHQLTSHTMWLA